jgi:hypothetical protein
MSRPLQVVHSTLPTLPLQSGPSYVLRGWGDYCARQTSRFEAPQNASHRETLDKDQWFAYLLRRDVHKGQMMPGMEGCQWQCRQELGTAWRGPDVELYNNLNN